MFINGKGLIIAANSLTTYNDNNRKRVLIIAIFPNITKYKIFLQTIDRESYIYIYIYMIPQLVVNRKGGMISVVSFTIVNVNNRKGVQ